MIRNPFGVLLVSVIMSLSILPFVTGFLLAGPAGGLVGLWTTSFLLGFLSVGGAQLMTITLEREVSLGTDHFWEGIRQGRRMGLAIGFGTFLVALVVLMTVVNPINGILGLSLMLVGFYLLLVWFTLVMFALTFWAPSRDHDNIRAPFLKGGTLILVEPTSAGWLLVQAIGWTLLSIPLIIAPMLVLPGFVLMISISIVRTAALDSPSHSIEGLSEN